MRNAIFVHVLANLQQTAAATALGAYLTPNALNKVDPQIKAASKLHYVAVKNGVWKVSRMPLLSASPLAAGSTELGSEVPPMLAEDDSDDECDHCEDFENCPCFSIPEKCTYEMGCCTAHVSGRSRSCFRVVISSVSKMVRYFLVTVIFDGLSRGKLV